MILDMPLARASSVPPAARAKRLHTVHAEPCWLLVLLAAVGSVTSLAACHSPLGTRLDAGHGPDAGPPDATPNAVPDVPTADLASSDRLADLPVTPDLASPDLASPELPPAAGVPGWFRIENHTDRTVYVPTDPDVLCGVPSGPSAGPCNFFGLGCALPCSSVSAGANCCVQCEQAVPAVRAIPPGGSHVVPWDGNLHAKATGTCSACECESTTPAASGTYQASTHAYTGYICQQPSCGADASGLITMAVPDGAETRIVTNFSIPSPDAEILLVIDRLLGLDAGAPPDTAPVDLVVVRDTLPDGIPDTFAALPGHTFEITANVTPPDASAPWGYPCKNAYPEVVYDMTFSDDGRRVHLTSENVPNHATMDGLLTSASATKLVYSIDDGWAGAELDVRLDGGTLVGQLSIFGSGVPVTFCMESAMQPL